MLKKLDILMVGVGGQGNVLASDILAEVSMVAGYDVKKTDTLGMAQRGGSVVSQIRIAERVWSPMIKEGEVDILVALEKLEAVRWTHYLQGRGVALINNLALPPLSVNLGLYRYPSDEEIRDVLSQVTDRVYFVNGTDKVKRLGDIRTLNMFMLGCVSSFIPVDLNTWKQCMSQRLPPDILEINMAAFDNGREEMSRVNL